MDLNKYIWKKMDALYMDRQQFDSLMDRLLTEILGRSVHPHVFEDDGYWEISTDGFTQEEMELILDVLKGNASKEDLTKINQLMQMRKVLS